MVALVARWEDERTFASVFLLEGLQPSWLDQRAERLGYENVGGSIIGLLVGLVVGLSLGLGKGLISVLKLGLVGGLTGMIIPELGVGLPNNIVLVESISWGALVRVRH